MSGQRVVRFKYNDEEFTMYEAALDRKYRMGTNEKS
ncbi:Uncharacterised protein [Weissella viridescens]|uniref:Uncharacterized protein n=1 Tax=Weissella viridescens TaxID=1629 RepID=A0A380P245_WEIVI|nr:Uncharacterised protein [Weissella viridescens]